MKNFNYRLPSIWRHKFAAFIIIVATPLMVGLTFTETALAAVYMCNTSGSHLCANSDGILYDHVRLANNGTQFYRYDTGRKDQGVYEIYTLEFNDNRADCMGVRGSDSTVVLKACSDNYTEWDQEHNANGSFSYYSTSYGGFLTSDNEPIDNLWVSQSGCGHGNCYQEWNN